MKIQEIDALSSDLSSSATEILDAAKGRVRATEKGCSVATACGKGSGRMNLTVQGSGSQGTARLSFLHSVRMQRGPEVDQLDLFLRI